MFHDRYLTKDELFAAAAVFTLIAWGFAFLYSICQILIPQSFQNPNAIGMQSWLDLLFLSFSLQSATGLSRDPYTDQPRSTGDCHVANVLWRDVFGIDRVTFNRIAIHSPLTASSP